MVFKPAVSIGNELYYGQKVYTDASGAQTTLDVDDTGTNGYFNPGGIETISVVYEPNHEYWFYVYDFSDNGGLNDPDLDLQVRWWYENCKTGTINVKDVQKMGNMSLSQSARVLAIGGFPGDLASGSFQAYPNAGGNWIAYCSSPGDGSVNAISNAWCYAE
jgi:hypothetical protein